MNELNLRWQLSRLPQVSLQLWPLVGENLNLRALKLREGVTSIEQMITDFRAKYSPEVCAFTRFYLLQPCARRRNVQERLKLYYILDLDKGTREYIGAVADDQYLESTCRVLIGNHARNRLMTTISWQLHGEIDGSDPLAIGRYDPWSLLQGVGEDSLRHLHESSDLRPDVSGWDFDMMFWGRVCPQCQTLIKINYFAYNIDSAQCSNCDCRPWLSHALGDVYEALLQIHGHAGVAVDYVSNFILNTVSWMGGVSARGSNLHERHFGGVVPQELLSKLAYITLGANPSQGLPALNIPRSSRHFDVAHRASELLIGAVDSGQPLGDVEVKLADLLKSISNESSVAGLASE